MKKDLPSKKKKNEKRSLVLECSIIGAHGARGIVTVRGGHLDYTKKKITKKLSVARYILHPFDFFRCFTSLFLEQVEN